MFRDLVDDLDNFSPEPHLFLDVPFVPSEEAVVHAILDLAGVGAKDILYDLGSGDGRILIAAARDRDARAIGIELDPVRIADTLEEAGHVGVEHLVDVIEEDLFTADISEATVVTLYLLDSVNQKLRPRLLKELRPGTRVVSHAFNMGDWKPDAVRELGTAKIYKWIVPARVEGAWEWEDTDGRTYRIDLQQQYQEVNGHASIDDAPADLESAVLDGHELTITIREDDSGAQHRFVLDFNDGEQPSVLRIEE